MSRCDAKIRPFSNPTELMCEHVNLLHNQHSSTLFDYAYPGSATVIEWLESDRRNFRGEWQPCGWIGGCVLPMNHIGGHAQ